MDAVIDPLIVLGFVGDDGTEEQAAEKAGSSRAAVTSLATAAVPATTTETAASAATPTLYLHDQRIAAGLRQKILRRGAGQRRGDRRRRARQQADADLRSECV
jgi:hypothetical protein